MESALQSLNSRPNGSNFALNSKKTKSLLLSTVQMSRAHSLCNKEIHLKLGTTVIERVENAKLFGVHFTEFLDWGEHMRYLLAFLSTDIFASFGVLPLLHLRAYTLQDATVYTCSNLYSGNFIISTVKSRYSHCFNCLKLFNEDRQYPKNGRFWP